MRLLRYARNDTHVGLHRRSLTAAPRADLADAKPFPWLSLVLTWLGWASAILGFQWLVERRLDILRPDYAREWTDRYTLENSAQGNLYLSEPFMQRQVAFDSEYYLSIAVGGYDDPVMRRISTPLGGFSQNYAFFPLYPLAMRLVAAPLAWLGISTPIGRAALAGVTVSLLGTLAGMLALYDLGRGLLDEQAAMRGVFYLLIFPSAIFLAVVFTEGLYIGISFTSLALARRGKAAWAALLAVPAFFTRSVGLMLVIPAGLAWLKQLSLNEEGRAGQSLVRPSTINIVLGALALLAPVAAYLLWRQSHYAQYFFLIEEGWFGHVAFDIPRSLWSWADAWMRFTTGHPHARVLHGLEFAGLLLSFVASAWLIRREPGLGLYSLALLLIPSFSGAFQSMIRYALVVPANYLFLAHLGRKPIFDRAWTVLSILLLGMETLLFTFDMWVA